MNVITLVGRITSDPEIRYGQSGVAVANFTLAVPRLYKDNDGNEVTDFIRVVAFKKQAENIGKYVQKGRRLSVSGSLYTNKYQTKDGDNRISYEVNAREVEFLDKSSKEDNNDDSSLPYDQNQSPGYDPSSGADDLPF